MGEQVPGALPTPGGRLGSPLYGDSPEARQAAAAEGTEGNAVVVCLQAEGL